MAGVSAVAKDQPKPDELDHLDMAPDAAKKGAKPLEKKGDKEAPPIELDEGHKDLAEIRLLEDATNRLRGSSW